MFLSHGNCHYHCHNFCIVQQHMPWWYSTAIVKFKKMLTEKPFMHLCSCLIIFVKRSKDSITSQAKLNFFDVDTFQSSECMRYVVKKADSFL